jgi:putative ABC transport system substrate-binding protein
MPRVVMVLTNTAEDHRPFTEAFLEGMRQAGQVEGRTFHLDMRFAGGDPARVPTLVRDSVAQRPAVLVVAGLIAARHAHDATSTIPVVVATSSDLVDAGIVKSLARPGGNITGVADLTDEIAVKRLELLKAALPNASRVALLVDPDFPATRKIEARVESAAPKLRIALTSLAIALDALERSRPNAVLVGGSGFLTGSAPQLIDRASALRIPVVHYWPGTVERGALLSYQVDVADNYRRAAGYVDKILKGANPGQLPIYQPTRYELVVNARVARAFGLTLPQGFLIRADRVIE